MKTRGLIQSGPKPNAAFPYTTRMLKKNLVAIVPLDAGTFMFESVDGRTHGRRLDGYTISSHCEPPAQVS